jgi:hypothetical protein
MTLIGQKMIPVTKSTNWMLENGVARKIKIIKEPHA